VVVDLDATLERLKGLGIEAEYRTVRSDYGMAIALIRDPEGHFIELYAPL
jgi:catechol 2,3-dioxygenase-like lactoylglutathione lyase family enzyme